MRITENSDLWQVPIQTMPLIQAFPDLERMSEISDPTDASEIRRFTQKKVVISEDHKRLFGVFSERSVVVPHAEALEIIDDVYREIYGEECSAEIISMKKGAQIRVKIDLPHERPINIGNDDVSNLHMFLYNAYDKALPFKLRMGIFRQVCSNGAVVGDTIANVDARQLLEGWNTKTLAEKVSRMIEDTRKVADIWRHWTQVLVPFETAELALENKFPKKMLEPVLIEDDFPMSKYELYQTMTRKATHDSRTERAQVAFDQMIARIFYGNNSLLSQEEAMVTDVEDNEIADVGTETEEIHH